MVRFTCEKVMTRSSSGGAFKTSKRAVCAVEKERNSVTKTFLFFGSVLKEKERWVLVTEFIPNTEAKETPMTCKERVKKNKKHLHLLMRTFQKAEKLRVRT